MTVEPTTSPRVPAASGSRLRRLRAGALLVVLVARTAGATCVAPSPSPGLVSDIPLTDREGAARAYDLYIPGSYPAASASGDRPVPLVVDLHGFDASKSQQRALSGFAAKADAIGFVVAYPNGRDPDPTDPSSNAGRGWNAYNCCGAAHDAGYDDVGFVRDVVADVSQRVNVDHRRIYVTGESNGASLTHRLACEAADLFAAAAPFSFDLALPDAQQGIATCTPSRPITVSIFRGYREGPNVVSAYCPGRFYPTFPGAQEGFADWAAADGCTGTPDEQVWSASGTQVACFPDSANNVTQTYPGAGGTCAGGVRVQLTSWDAGHVTIYPFSDGANKAWDGALASAAMPGLPDADGDGIADVDDDCPDAFNPGQEDGDGDCRGDACTPVPCGALEKPRLRIGGNGDPAGDERLTLSGRFAVSSATPAIDPIANGLDVVVSDATGTLVYERRIPGGTVVASGQPGWKVNAAGNRWIFADRAGALAPGIVRAVVKNVSKSSLPVLEVSVTGKGSDFQMLPSELPAAVSVVAGGDDAAAAGQCAEVMFHAAGGAPPACKTSASGSSVSCK
ncbi:MAG TPA: PHB depolymerase family esterase [Candidatus Binatia bacterium]|nr:PHB depolymerase family esterase [Candidatus Binatia bacterium]